MSAPVTLSTWWGREGPVVQVGDHEPVPVQSVSITDSGEADLSPEQALEVAGQLLEAAAPAPPAAALTLFRVVWERVTGWCNDPLRVSMSVDVQYVVAENADAAQRFSTLPAVTDVLEVGPLPAGPGLILEEPAPAHVGEVSDRFSQPFAQASCSCGWSGPTRHGLRTRGRDAHADLAEHYREANDGT